MFRPPTASSAAGMEESTNAILDNNTQKKSAVNNGKYNNLMGKKNSSTFGVKSQSTFATSRISKNVPTNNQNLTAAPGSFQTIQTGSFNYSMKFPAPTAVDTKGSLVPKSQRSNASKSSKTGRTEYI